MKKTCNYFLFLLFMFTFYIGFTSAESCVVESGTGKNIGDEIVCGTEHFYVISNDGENIKMLGKYNLMAGASYDYIELDDYVVDEYYEIYNHPKVKDRIEEGYTIKNAKYTQDSSSGKYTFNSVSLMDDYLYNEKIIWLSKTMSSTEEVMNSTEVKEYLNNGYNISDSISNDEGYIGLEIYNSEIQDIKTIYLDKTYKSFYELYSIDSIKKLVDDGYYVYSVYYNETKDDNKHDYYAVTLIKYLNYEATNVMFEEPLTRSDFNSFVENNAEIQKKLDEGYDYYYYNEHISNSWRYHGLYLYKVNNDAHLVKTYQNELALGINGEAGNPQYPFYGIVNTEFDFIYMTYDESKFIGEEYGGGNYQDLDFEGYKYFNWYKNTLIDMGYPVKSVSTLSVTELNETIKRVTGKEIDLQSWYENKVYIDEADAYILGSIKELLDGHEWIYSTAYWLSTMTPGYSQHLYNITTLGDLCASHICKNEPTTGIRPLVTISADDVVYKIETKTDGNGTIVPSTETEYSGKEVTFVVTPNEGYVLSLVKVTDSSGNTVTFTDYKFTMPDKNVLIEATFVPDNPDTGDAITIISFVVLLVLALIKLRSWKKMKFLE